VNLFRVGVDKNHTAKAAENLYKYKNRRISIEIE